jgi:hypothetical protein
VKIEARLRVAISFEAQVQNTERARFGARKLSSVLKLGSPFPTALRRVVLFGTICDDAY